MYVVVGSGPCGLACADALLEAGAQVTLIDVGRTLEPERAVRIESMRMRSPSEWHRDERNFVSSTPPPREPALPKFVFGSEFPYIEQAAVLLQQSGTACTMSWAQGGLSNVWGAAMLPWRDHDLVGWPLGSADLAPHYHRVAEMVGLAGTHDTLESWYPHHGPPGNPMEPSRQAHQILALLDDNREILLRHGVVGGQSRLAARTTDCRQCQLCLSGCVYDAIYSARHTLERLVSNPRFTYRKGLRVLKVTDGPDAASVSVRPIDGGGVHSLVAKRVFVAAGALASSAIVVASLGVDRIELPLLFHPYFLQLAITDRTAGDVTRDPLHALAQVFIELIDPALCERTIHLQVYTYTPMFATRLRSFGLPGRLLAPALVPRLVAVQGYLHSGENEPIRLQLRIEPTTGEPAWSLSGAVSPETRRLMRRTTRKMLGLRRMTGITPIPGAMKVGRPGEGNHIGGTFPMARDPRGMQSDLLGRVYSLQRTHVVDAAVLPSLAAPTLTFTAMANARRITLSALALERGNG